MIVQDSILLRKLREVGGKFFYVETLEDMEVIRVVDMSKKDKRFLAKAEIMGNSLLIQRISNKTTGLLKEIT
jgi:hypothetical protein